MNFRSCHELYVTYLHGHVTIQSNQKTGDVYEELKCNARTLTEHEISAFEVFKENQLNLITSEHFFTTTLCNSIISLWVARLLRINFMNLNNTGAKNIANYQLDIF